MQARPFRTIVYRTCLLSAGFVLFSATLYAQEALHAEEALDAEELTVPLPEPNPKRQTQTSTDKSPPAPAPPPLPGDRPTVPWKDPKIREARSACAEMLAGLDIDYEQLDPIKKGLCGAPAPILVKSIGQDPAVTISPPATMTCKLAVALHAWFKDTVQPSASELGTSVVKIRNASSYKCRNRYGQADTKISEHALANALDISEFVFASGQRIKLLGNWPYGALAALPLKPEPPTPNPQRNEPVGAGANETPDEKAAPHSNLVGETLDVVLRVRTNPFVRPPVEGRSDPAGKKIATAKSNPFVRPPPKPATQSAVRPPQNSQDGKEAQVVENSQVVEDSQVADNAAKPRSIDGDEAKAFLKLLHTEACKTFETVLGPDANAAHKDHFHLDMKKRRYVKICE